MTYWKSREDFERRRLSVIHMEITYLTPIGVVGLTFWDYTPNEVKYSHKTFCAGCHEMVLDIHDKILCAKLKVNNLRLRDEFEQRSKVTIRSLLNSEN